MSEEVHYKGKLKLVEKSNGESLEDLCKKLLGRKLDTYEKSYIEAFKDDNYMDYYINNDNLYKVSYEEIYDNSVFNANVNDNNEIEFEVCYYNGGCSFDEALDKSIKSMRRN